MTDDKKQQKDKGGIVLRSIVSGKDGLILGAPAVTIDVPVAVENKAVILPPSQPQKMLSDTGVKIGDMVPGKGVFIGSWVSDKLSMEFNLYAAPRDDRGLFEYAKSSSMIGDDLIQIWSMKELCGLVKAGHYRGQWFIPPFEILETHIFGNREAGALKGTFRSQQKRDAFSFPDLYWSCTRSPKESAKVLALNFYNGREEETRTDMFKQSVRRIRAERVGGMFKPPPVKGNRYAL